MAGLSAGGDDIGRNAGFFIVFIVLSVDKSWIFLRSQWVKTRRKS